MTIAEILAWLAVFAAAFAVLGVIYGRRKGAHAHPLYDAGSGLLVFAIGGGLIALAILIVSPFLGVQQ
jgi:hypothetical protein